MSDDDDDKRGSRDNTGYEHKPRYVRNKENAPRGHLGRNSLKPPTPGFGSGMKPQQGKQKFQGINQAPEQSQKKDTQPSEKQKVEGPKVSKRQSDFAKALRRANAQTRAMKQSRGIDYD